MTFLRLFGHGQVAAVTKIQSVHRAVQIRIIYHEVVAAVRRARQGLAFRSGRYHRQRRNTHGLYAGLEYTGTAMVRNLVIIVNHAHYSALHV